MELVPFPEFQEPSFWLDRYQTRKYLDLVENCFFDSKVVAEMATNALNFLYKEEIPYHEKEQYATATVSIFMELTTSCIRADIELDNCETKAYSIAIGKAMKAIMESSLASKLLINQKFFNEASEEQITLLQIVSSIRKE